MNISFRADRGKWGFVKSINGVRYKLFRWDTAESAEEAFEQFMSERRESALELKNERAPTLSARLGDLKAPGVYAVLRDGRVFYIGSTREGINRPVRDDHHRAREFKANDRLIFWRCFDEAAAVEMEKQLIIKYQPPLNCRGLPGRFQFKKTSHGRFAGSLKIAPTA